LSTDNPIDNLLRSAINFLDVQDIATVNRIIEETTRTHQTRFMLRNPLRHEEKDDKNVHPSKANKVSDESLLLKHFNSALGLEGEKSTFQQKCGKLFGHIPLHLIQAYYILRHMKSRDFKI
jgi:hypothetical protein